MYHQLGNPDERFCWTKIIFADPSDLFIWFNMSYTMFLCSKNMVARIELLTEGLYIGIYSCPMSGLPQREIHSSFSYLVTAGRGHLYGVILLSNIWFAPEGVPFFCFLTLELEGGLSEVLLLPYAWFARGSSTQFQCSRERELLAGGLFMGFYSCHTSGLPWMVFFISLHRVPVDRALLYPVPEFQCSSRRQG